MFGLSFFEVVVVGVVALLVLGPERIPSVARSIGRILADLRRATDEVKREFSVHDILRERPSLEQRPVENNRGTMSSLVSSIPAIETPLEKAPVLETNAAPSPSVEAPSAEAPSAEAGNAGEKTSESLS